MHKYGNRHKLPMPTAYPIIERINSNRPPHVTRSLSSIIQMRTRFREDEQVYEHKLAVQLSLHASQTGLIIF